MMPSSAIKRKRIIMSLREDDASQNNGIAGIIKQPINNIIRLDKDNN